MASDKPNGVMAEYSAEYTESQRQLAREKLDSDSFVAEQEVRQENADAQAASTQRQALLERCKAVPVYTRISTPVEPFESVTACIDVIIEAAAAFRRGHAETGPSSNFGADVVRSKYEERLLAMLEARLISLVEPATMLPWRGDPERSDLHDLLLARNDLVLFAKHQGVEVSSAEGDSVSDYIGPDEVGEKSWPFVYATMAALAYLSGVKEHKIVSSVAAVLQDTKCSISESTVRKYFDQIRKQGITPNGKIPRQNYGERPIRGGDNDAED